METKPPLARSIVGCAPYGLRNRLQRLLPPREWRSVPLLLSASIIVLLILVAFAAPVIAPHDPLQIFPGQMLQGPNSSFWLGTDELSRDLASRLIYGARTSLQVSVFAVTIAIVFGTTIGLVAGYYGGIVDMILMRLMDVILAFPTMILAITVVTFMGNTIPNLILVIGLLYIPGTARIIYSTTLAIKHQQFVEAARSIGATSPRIIVRHLLPNSIAPIFVQTALCLGFAILLEAGLSFLGLGPPPPTPTWGQMISVGRRYIFDQPFVLIAPMILVSVAILSFNILADALRDVLDPRLKMR